MKLGADGKPIYGPDRKPIKEKVRMANGTFRDGREQKFYFPEGHPQVGLFKGMATILEERGYTGCNGMKGKLAECAKFKCPPQAGAVNCCCRRILFNEPDFVNVPSLLELECNARGYGVNFLPKFHPELNPIEQCWGSSKRTYRKFPASSKEADLERNVVDALDSVPLLSIRRFCTRSRRFMDGYRKGLNGAQAAYASKLYKGHRCVPKGIMEEVLKAKVGVPV